MNPNQNLRRASEDNMQKSTRSLHGIWLAALALSLGVGGCFEQLPTVHREQTNLIDKSVFEGEWWYTRTIIDIDEDALTAVAGTGAFSPWPGAVSSYDLGSNSGVIGRIRWVLDENFIYAYRSTEIIVGSNTDVGDADFRGSPLAVYRILNHVDVRQEFNPTTGEPTNVISESSDRQWYDRQYVRVDWSTNLVSFGLFVDSLDFDQLFGTWRREPIPLSITDEGNSSMGEGFENLPVAWRPQMVTVGEDDGYRFRADWPSGTEDTVHYMSFVTQDMWTPLQCFGSACGTSIVLTTRDAFLRIPPNHEYAVEQLQNSEYDRFGILRTEARTYIRGGRARDELGQWCNTNAECVTGACNTATHICEGGLSDELGETDFLTYYRLRHNFYSDSLTDTECVADWQCSERFASDTDGDGVGDSLYDFNGNGARDGGSTCDIAARRCTIPLADRTIRPVHYTLSQGYPTYTLRSAFQLMASWNESFMLGNRALHGTAAPDLSAAGPSGNGRIACQSDNPTEYCFCAGGGRGGTTRSAEVAADGTCEYRYDFFRSPEALAAEGVVNPYRCWVAGAGDAPVADLANPTNYTDYDPAVWAQLHFVGDECMLVLDVNSCDRDPSLAETDPGACEQLGDPRYQFMNWVEGPVDFCGVMQPVQDPTNGEAVISPINMSGNCAEAYGSQALVSWPLFRGDVEGIEDGEDVRRYFAARGRVRPPAGFAPGADPGGGTAGSRPVLPTDISAYVRETVAANLDRLSELHGAEGRAMLMSDRLHDLRGSATERTIASALAAEGFVSPSIEEELAAEALDAPSAMPASVDLDDPANLARLSPFDNAFLDSVTLDRRRQQVLESMGVCFLGPREALMFQSQWLEYWAQAFDGFDDATARIRWEQAWHRAVMQHELGHGLGLEHNFAATLDRDNYQDPAYAIMEAHPLPRLEDYDTNVDGAFTDVEVQAFYDDLDEVRRTRNLLGLGNYTSASTMDYPGDLSDQFGLGPYDRGAVLFNYFNEIEAFRGDPRTVAPTSSLDGLIRSDENDRVTMSWYRGGESCHTDSECPYSGDAGATVDGQLLLQRCVTNPRFSSIPEPCGSDDQHCICSSFDEDFIDYASNIPPYNNDADGDGEMDYFPVRYLFCSNPRLNDISWCNTFDAGESFTEVIANMRTTWEYRYPSSYFRHYRRGFTAGSRARTSIIDAAKIYQHLLFRLIYEQGFDSDTTPLGLNDQFFASIDIMNWFARLAQAPDVGSYELDPVTNTYVRMGEELDMTGADMVIEPGTGYHAWSRYQEGALGFFRMERSGVMWDKILALQALTIRDWNLNFSIDERYFINFYDFFPREMTELFGGYVVDDPRWFAPRVTDVDAMGRPSVEYVNLFAGGNGGCASGAGRVSCRLPIREEYTDPAIGGTSNDILRTLATSFALAEFPVFYDTSWERRLSVFTLDNGDGWTLPDRQADGSPTCGYLDVIPGSGHATCPTPEAADYILYTSNRLHTTYVAVKVRTELEDPGLEQEQLGFELLLGLSEAQERFAFLDDGHPLTAAERVERDRLRTRIARDESFLQNLIELQRTYGITSWL